MKIIIVGINSWYIYHFWLPLINELKKKYNLFIVTEYDEYSNKLEEKGFNCIYVNFSNRSLNILKNIKAIYKIFSIYKKIKPDLVHHFNPKPVIIGSLVAHILKIRFIINSYPGLGNLFRKDKIKFNIIRPFILLAYIAINRKNVNSIFQVKKDEELFIKKKLINKSKTNYISSSGVDTMKFKMRDSFNMKNKLKVAMISRINVDKGIDTYLKIVKKLNDRCDFFLAGQFYQFENTRFSESQLIESCNENSITYLSFVKDMSTFLNQIDILILPTRRLEGVPKIILESCSCGVVPIASDIGGCGEIVLPDINGYLIEMNNIDMFVNKIKILDKDRLLMSYLGKNGRKLVEKNFEVSNIIANYMHVYKSKSIL